MRHSLRRFFRHHSLLPALTVVACLALPAPRASTPQPADARRIVLLGLDAADWLAIDPLVTAGKLPTFARLKQLGRTGIMLSTPPLVRSEEHTSELQSHSDLVCRLLLEK